MVFSFQNYTTDRKLVLVSHPIAKARGLCLDSTATLHTDEGVQLWLQRPIHQGLLTRAPCSSSLAGRAAFARQYSERQPDQHGVYSDSSDRQTRVLSSGDWHPRYDRTSGKPCSYSARQLDGFSSGGLQEAASVLRVLPAACHRSHTSDAPPPASGSIPRFRPSVPRPGSVALVTG
jgi:hypothetical protein